MSLGPSNTAFRYDNGKSLRIVPVTAHYTLSPNDNGAVIEVDSGSGVNVTVPSLLPVGFNCIVAQVGAGQVTFVTSSTTINNVSSHTKTSGQYAEVSLVSRQPDIYLLAGSTGA